MSFFSNKKRDNLSSPIQINEVNALIRYASEKGLDPKAEIIPALEQAKADYEKNNADTTKFINMLKQYTFLAAKTTPISGRILIDSENSDHYLKWLVIWTVMLIAVAATDGVLTLWYLDQPTPDLFSKSEILQYLLNYLSPFIWGALGACVYLLKHLYDIATIQQFDAALFRGWWVRLVLGAVLGGVVTQIFEFTTEEASAAAELSATAVAFLTGLGVRVVYGAFERTVEVLAEKMNLGKVRSTKRPQMSVDARTVLSKQLAKINPDLEPDKYQALLELIRDLGGKEDKPQDEDDDK